jgi:antitoxin component of MazEF toxin-antitoxin module
MTQLDDASAAFTHDRPPESQGQETAVDTTIRKIGNGAFLPLTQPVLRALSAETGQTVRLTVRDGVLTAAPVDGPYQRTRAAARAARGRYPKTLDILGQ